MLIFYLKDIFWNKMKLGLIDIIQIVKKNWVCELLQPMLKMAQQTKCGKHTNFKIDR